MSQSIVRQLVLKDVKILKTSVLLIWLGGVASILLAILGGPAMSMTSTILFITAMGGAAIYVVMMTVVEERREQTLAFFMSLPVTVRQYTTAKLISNVLLFGFIWLTLSAASYVVFVGDEGLPDGTIPFLTIILVGIFLGFTLILATSLVTESLGWAIAATVGANIGTQIYLWWVVDLHGIRSVIGGPVAVWNGTALAILGSQVAASFLLIGLTYWLQSRKTDFI